MDTQFKAKVAVPSDHPSITFPSGALPASHANIDTILKNPTLHPLPVWHPALSSYLVYGQPATTAVPISASHPDIDEMISSKIVPPLAHPSVRAKFMSVVAATHPGTLSCRQQALKSLYLTPPSIRCCLHSSDIDVIFRNPATNPIPSWHPRIGGFFLKKPPVKLSIPISAAHPDINTVVATREALPTSHPSVKAKFVGMVGTTHPGLNMIWVIFKVRVKEPLFECSFENNIFFRYR